MAAADDECYDQGGEVDEQLEDGNAASRIKLHFEGLDTACGAGVQMRSE
jgi:hypothetical protein